MNSTSKKFVDPCNGKHDEDEPKRKCHRKDDDQEFVLLKVGNTNAPVGVTNSTQVYTLATLPVKIGCLDDPEIKIDFATNVTTPIGNSSIITLQVNKTFINHFSPLVSSQVGPTWTYTGVSGNPNIITNIISFFVKDTDADNFDDDVVRYTVTAITNNTFAASTVTFNNSTLAVTIAAEK